MRGSEMEQVDAFIGKLQSIRETRSLLEMSEETGVKMPTLSRILNRQRSPSCRIMVMLLIAYPKLAETFWGNSYIVRTSIRKGRQG